MEWFGSNGKVNRHAMTEQVVNKEHISSSPRGLKRWGGLAFFSLSLVLRFGLSVLPKTG